MKRPKYILSNERFKFFLDRYVEYGGGELKFTPIVGDPLVDSNLIDKIKMAKVTGKINHLYLYTNLIGLDKFDIKEFLLSGIDRIYVSTCIGSRTMYKKLFGVDKYNLVWGNLLRLVSNNAELDNEVKIDVILRYEKPHRKLFTSFEYEELESYGIEPRVVENYDNWCGLIRKEDLPKGQVFREVEDMSKPCSLFYKGLIILNNGDVGACWCRDLEAKLVVGNVYKQSLGEIWNGERMNKLREDWWEGKIPTICKNCYQYTPVI